jgi:hypothetical protein
VVVVMEHADGSAGVAQRPDGSWMYYTGLGTGAALEAKCHYRLQECDLALQLLHQLNAGGVRWVPAVGGAQVHIILRFSGCFVYATCYSCCFISTWSDVWYGQSEHRHGRHPSLCDALNHRSE